MLATVIVGCGSDRLSTIPVRGAVRVDGKPVAGVQVVLHPVPTDDSRLAKLRPTGRTSSDGTFMVGTYEMADGAPAADYRITAEWFGGGPETTTSTSEDPESASNGTESDRLKGRFANPETSGLKATISQTASDIPPLELTTRSVKPPS